MRPLIVAAVLIVTFSRLAGAADSPLPASASAAAVIREMNAARQNPQLYAGYIEDLRATFDGSTMTLPGGKRFRTKEGSHALDEAIGFLRAATPMAPLIFSPGMSRAAADHCMSQIGGGFGHAGGDRSDPGARMNRYGAWSLGWGENLAYGKNTARDVVVALIVDDGLRERKHRKNIFSAKFAVAGAAFGKHAKFGAVCSIDFAGAYAEAKGETPSGLLATN